MELKNTEYEVDSQGVAIIWLNRPHRMNAWTGRLHTEYRHLLERANSDTAVRAIVVTGRGPQTQPVAASSAPASADASREPVL